MFAFLSQFSIQYIIQFSFLLYIHNIYFQNFIPWKTFHWLVPPSSDTRSIIRKIVVRFCWSSFAQMEFTPPFASRKLRKSAIVFTCFRLISLILTLGWWCLLKWGRKAFWKSSLYLCNFCGGMEAVCGVRDGGNAPKCVHDESNPVVCDCWPLGYRHVLQSSDVSPFLSQLFFHTCNFNQAWTLVPKNLVKT